MIQNKKIITFIEQNYPLSNIKLNKVLQQKGGRYVSKISSEEGIFVFKLSNNSKSNKEMKKDMYIFDYAEENNFFHIPKLLKTKKGKSFINLNDRYAHIMEYINGGEPEDNEKNWKEMGKITAKLHKLSGYKYYTSFTLDSEKENYKNIAKTIPFGKEYLKLAENLPSFYGCSKSVIHSDIGIHNSAKDKNGNIYFIDWDGVGIGLSIIDIGFPLLSQFLSLDLLFHKKKAKNFYSEYFKLNPMKDQEKELLFDAGLFFLLIYLPYGDMEKNWNRIQFANKNRKNILSTIL